MSELPGQVQVGYLEPGQIQTEERTEVSVEQLNVEWVNQMPGEVQTELLEANLEQVTPEIMNQEEREPIQADAVEAAREAFKDADGLETKPTVDSQVERAENENRVPVPILE
ncbi:zinc finger protein 131-like [Lynx pardinus]|uniref:Zinc finger protein 131-like n=1 Tax=Lynx pardinus TaxID=191816 RepID=A0A485NHZ0_LYNPA|nr:zinc finger protein 131-like [Lynx pardinus]